MCVCVCECVCVCAYVCVRVCVCMCVGVYLCACVRAREESVCRYLCMMIIYSIPTVCEQIAWMRKGNVSTLMTRNNNNKQNTNKIKKAPGSNSSEGWHTNNLGFVLEPKQAQNVLSITNT